MSPEATLAGRAIPLAEAVSAAAGLLRDSRRSVIAGLETDVAGVAAAVALARRLGGAVDHADAAACLRDQDSMRGGGWIVTTPLQVRARADTVLLAGVVPGPDWPDLGLDRPPPLHPDRPRKVLSIDGTAETVGSLRACLAGRQTRTLPDGIAELATTLAAARYAAVVWEAARLDALDVAMLCGLVDDLNATTRCAGLPMPPASAAGAMQAAAWLTGQPLPLGFSAGRATHDPLLFDARRMVESGEADAVVWVATGPTPPPWSRPVPTVALLAPGARLDPPADVAIPVGRPGVDHDSVLFDPALGTLAARAASAPSGVPACAEMLRRITAALTC